MDKKFLFRIFLLILALLASILACLVTLLVFSLSNASENERLSENESRSENKSRSEYESRIVCGIVPYHGLNPWMVQVFAQRGSKFGRCGGSFISEEHVLTAAHCIYANNSTKSLFHIYFNRQFIEASLVAFEPHYDQKKCIAEGKTDLAILKVKEKPIFVVPLCLPPKNYFVQKTDLILTSPREGYHEKVISVIDGKTCWQRYFRNTVAANSTWCGKDQEFKRAVEAYEEETRNKNEDLDLNSLKVLCGAEAKQYTFKGDSGSPLVQQDQNERWYLIAIVRGSHTYNWKESICDNQTKIFTVDDFQPLVPNLAWIYETLKIK